jgi:hypothetical protein
MQKSNPSNSFSEVTPVAMENKILERIFISVGVTVIYWREQRFAAHAFFTGGLGFTLL